MERKRKRKKESIDKEHHLFYKYDDGVRLLADSYFETTPEKLARHQADRCRSKVAIDLFCGVGGNSIQLAQTCDRVLAIDGDPMKIDAAENNARVYGVEKSIDFVLADAFELYSTLSTYPDIAEALRKNEATLFLSPPWGGPSYKNHAKFDCEELLAYPFSDLYNLAIKYTKNFAVYLPRNLDKEKLAKTVQELGYDGVFEIEEHFYGDWLTAVTVYFGDLVRMRMPTVDYQ